MKNIVHLKLLSDVASKNKIYPNVIINPDFMVASDYETTLRINSDTGLLSKVAVNAKKLFQLKGDYIDLPDLYSEFNDSQVVYEINPSAILDVKKLLVSLKEISYAMAKNDVRYYLNGIGFKIEDDKLQLTASDGCNIGVATLGYAGTIEKAFIIPRDGITLLIKLLSIKGLQSNLVGITLRDEYIVFSIDEYEMYITLVDGKYPDFSRVFANAQTSTIESFDYEKFKSESAKATILDITFLDIFGTNILTRMIVAYCKLKDISKLEVSEYWIKVTTPIATHLTMGKR